MFDAIISAIEFLWNKLRDALQVLQDFWRAGYVWICGVVVVLLGVVKSIADSVYSAVQSIITAVAAIVMPATSGPTPAAKWLDTANTFFPVSEGFVFLLALSALWIACLTYRALKSWIPTVS